ncbi:alpha/beta hydrolase [Candidatus Parabeggiatoa sp. HSG14]|uniref:alpha/beta hydrolase n=1 Tax=Candidatus Parabeggiatoa sp. HSG14 TaxID=3055593 RepID=UPI0025A80057|nr:alpha/beta hydrolase [Thiotrichales bacterium HSG14]
MMRWLTLSFFSLLMLSACNGLFFHPQSRLLGTPAQLNLAYEDIFFNTADAVRLHGWWLSAQTETLGTIIFLHGNAENMSTHISSVVWLPSEGFNVFLFDYRGYGLSQGKPDFEGLHHDVEAVLALVTQREDASSNLIVFGQSLGASLAITSLAASAYKDKIRALIIDSAFSGYRNIVQEKLASFWLTWPFQWPLSLGISNTYQPLKDISRLNHIPVLIIHGTADQIIPVHHAQRLYVAAKQPKQIWLIPKGKHIQSMSSMDIRQRLLDYLLKIQANTR